MLPCWPNHVTIKDTMPAIFKDQYPNTSVILDATEIKVNTPSSLLLQSQTYSNYKSTNTFKARAFIYAYGVVTYCHTYSALVFSLDSPIAPQQRNQNFNSAILSASGSRFPKEDHGISPSVNSPAINGCGYSHKQCNNYKCSPIQNGGIMLP